MRRISSETIKDAVADLCVKSNLHLRADVLAALKTARLKETRPSARNILEAIIKNASLARKEGLAICQDTGFPTIFLQIGQEVQIIGDLARALNQGVEEGYRRAALRSSIVMDPLLRGKCGFSPVAVHTDIVKGSRISIKVLPKGFGCENKTQLKMFNPTAKIEEIKKFIIEAVKLAGPDACPPYIIGVGIGGSADLAVFLAKKALLQRLTKPRALAAELLQEINLLRIGPMGLGGKVTALGVNIEKHATHIAGLPVAVSISCHALRSAEKII